MQLKIKRRSAAPVPQTHTGKNVVTENCYNKLKALGKTVKEAGGSMSNLTFFDSKKVNALIKNECCNYDAGNCVVLDDGEYHACPQRMEKKLICKWFKEAVLPLGPVLEAAVLRKEDPSTRCEICGTVFIPRSNRAKRCPGCSQKVKRKQQREYARKRRSSSTIRAKKPGTEDSENLQNLEGKGKHLTPSKNGVLTVDKRLRIASKNGGGCQ